MRTRLRQKPPPLQPQPAAPLPELSITSTDKTLVTIDSPGAASAASGQLQDGRQSREPQPTATRKRGAGRVGSGQLSGGGLGRIVRLLSSSKNSPNATAPAPSGSPAPPPRASNTGSTASVGASTGGGGAQQQEQQIGHSGAVSSRLLQHPKSSTQQQQPDKTGRWWGRCLPPQRHRDGEQHDLTLIMDTCGSASRPADLTNSMDLGSIPVSTHTLPPSQAPPAPAPPAPAQSQTQQLQQHRQQQQQTGNLTSQLSSGGGAAADPSGSVGSSGQMDPERFVRFRKASGRHLRASLERNIQNRATRNGSGPGGGMSGNAASLIFSTSDSKPRESFESDWDVMGAENDGNALSAVGVAMSTTALEGNSGPTGSRSLMAVVAAMTNTSNGDSGGDGHGGAHGRQPSKRRMGPTTASRSSRDHQEHSDMHDGSGTHMHGQQDMDTSGRDRQRSVMRSPTSSSNMPVDLSFNPNAQHGGGGQRDMRTVAASITAKSGRMNKGSGGGATGGGDGAPAGSDPEEGYTAISTRHSTPEDLLAAQMMALQNRINALTDEDLLNPSGKLGFISPPPQAPAPSAPHPTAQLTLLQYASAPSMPYSSGSEAGHMMVPGHPGGSPHNHHHNHMQQHYNQQQHHHHNQQQQQHNQYNQHNYNQYQNQELHLQPHPNNYGPPGAASMGGMGALDALSAFLGSPPSRGGMYDGAGNMLMATGNTTTGGSGCGTRPSAGSPGSAGGGGSLRSVGGCAAGGGMAGGGMRSMQSINEDGFANAQIMQGGGSSHRLASSHLGGMGGVTSNSSFMSVRPGPGSDDPAAILLTRDDTGLLGPASRGQIGVTRSSDTETGGATAQQDSGRAGSMAPGIFLSTRGSSLGERAAVFAGNSRPGESTGVVRGGGSTSSRGQLSPLIAPPAPAAGGGGGAGRFTLAAALSLFQEELQQSILPPPPAAATGGGGAGGGTPPSTSGVVPTATARAGSGGSESADLSAAGPIGGVRARPGTDAAATAAALGRGAAGGMGARDLVLGSDRGFVREPGSSNGVAGVGLALGGGGPRRGLSVHQHQYPHQPHPHNQNHYNQQQQQLLIPDSPDFVMQQLLNSNNMGGQHNFPGPHPLQHHVSATQLHLQHHAQQPHHRIAGATGGVLGHVPGGARGTTRPSADPAPSSRRQSTDYLYDEFFSNAPLPYDLNQPHPGGPTSGPGGPPSSSMALESTDATGGGAAYGRGGPGPQPVLQGTGGFGGQGGGHAPLGPGPPPIQNRSVRRNISAESLRIQAAHRSMEGRVAAAVAGGGGGSPHHMQWGATPPSPLSATGGRPPSPQGMNPRMSPGQIYQQQTYQQQVYQGHPAGSHHSSDRLGEPTHGNASPEAAVAASFAAASVASSNGATQGTGQAGQQGSSQSVNGSSNISCSNGAIVDVPLSALGHSGGGSRIFGGSSSFRNPSKAAAVELFGGGGYDGPGGHTSTDAVVAGLMESVLRSGAAAALLEDGGGGATADEGPTSGQAHGLSILPPTAAIRSVSMGVGGGGGRRSPSSVGSVASQQQQQGRMRPSSVGTAGTSTAGATGSGVPTGTGARQSGGGVAAAAAAAPAGGAGSRSLETLMAFCDESGQPLVQLMQPMQSADSSCLQQQQQQQLRQQQQQQHMQQQHQVQQLQQQQQHQVQQQQLQQQQQMQTWSGPQPVVQAVNMSDVSRPQYGTGEVLLLAAGGLVILFNLVIIVYVLVTMQLLLERPGSGSGTSLAATEL